MKPELIRDQWVRINKEDSFLYNKEGKIVYIDDEFSTLKYLVLVDDVETYWCASDEIEEI